MIPLLAGIAGYIIGKSLSNNENEVGLKGAKENYLISYTKPKTTHLEVNKHTFHLKTDADFQFIDYKTSNDTFKKLIDKHGLFFKSNSGSQYVVTEKGVYRYSDHWGRVASCNWNLKGWKQPQYIAKFWRIGYCDFKDFKSRAKWEKFIEFNSENKETKRKGKWTIPLDKIKSKKLKLSEYLKKHYKNIKDKKYVWYANVETY